MVCCHGSSSQHGVSDRNRQAARCLLTMSLLRELQASLWVTELCQDEEAPSKERPTGWRGGHICCRGTPALQNAACMVTPHCTSHLFHQRALPKDLPDHCLGGHRPFRARVPCSWRLQPLSLSRWQGWRPWLCKPPFLPSRRQTIRPCVPSPPLLPPGGCSLCTPVYSCFC